MARPVPLVDRVAPEVGPARPYGGGPQPVVPRLGTDSGGVCGCTFAPLRDRRVAFFFKRLFDLVGASLLLVLLAPLFVAVAMIVRLDSSGPVFLGQVRVGRDMRLFKIWKFRTMRVGADLQRAEVDRRKPAFPLHKVVKDPRATRSGRVLRRWSIDELPQLWNVLRGDMSLVGPRPRLPEEVIADGLRQSLRLGVRPGATGPLQVNGRSDLTYADGVALDLGYVRHWSLVTDLKVLARTPWAVLSGRGAY